MVGTFENRETFSLDRERSIIYTTDEQQRQVHVYSERNLLPNCQVNFTKVFLEQGIMLLVGKSAIPEDEERRFQFSCWVVDLATMDEVAKFTKTISFPGCVMYRSSSIGCTLSPEAREGSEDAAEGIRYLSMVIETYNQPNYLATIKLSGFFERRSEVSSTPKIEQCQLMFDLIAISKFAPDAADFKISKVFYLEDRLYAVLAPDTNRIYSNGEVFPLQFKIAEMSSNLTESKSEWKYFSFSSTLLASYDISPINFEHLGENLLLIRQKKPLMILDLDSWLATRISFENRITSSSDRGIDIRGISAFGKINDINYWYDFEALFDQLVEKKRLARQTGSLD